MHGLFRSRAGTCPRVARHWLPTTGSPAGQAQQLCWLGMQSETVRRAVTSGARHKDNWVHKHAHHGEATPCTQNHCRACRGPHTHTPVAMLVHVAVLVAVPPPQLLLHAAQPVSFHWTGWLQLVWLCSHKLPGSVDSSTPFSDAAGVPGVMLRGATASPKVTAVRCCRMRRSLLQGTSAQSLALHSWQHWPAGRGCLQARKTRMLH